MRFKFYKTCILFFFSSCAVFCFAPDLRAATFTVTDSSDTTDVTPGDGLCADSSGKCTLRAAVMESNALYGLDTITIEPMTIVLVLGSSGENNAVEGDLDIDDDVEIAGGGSSLAVIDANANDRAFDLQDGATAKFVGLTIQNGAETNGAGVRTNTGINASGGAIVFEGVVLANNHAEDDGGAVWADSASVTITGGSTVTDNTAGNRGGGVYTWTTDVDIYDSFLHQNEAGSYGGAAHLSRGAIYIASSVFSDNDGDYAGAVYIADTELAFIHDSQFGFNEASPYSGGALMLEDSNVVIGSSFFHDNEASAYGGGIYALTTDLDLDDVSVDANASYYAGGLYLSGHLTSLDSEFNDNTASVGGGVYLTNADVIFEDSSIVNNVGGGGQFLNGSSVEMHRSLVRDNEIDFLTTGGGGIFVDDSDLVLQRVSIIDNRSGDTYGVGDGGGIYLASGSIDAENVTLSGNRADADGGGIYAEAGSFSGTNLTLTKNAADADLDGSGVGTGIYESSASIVLGHTILAQNGLGGIADCWGTIASVGYNIVGSTGLASSPKCSGFAATDQVGTTSSPVDAKLSPLRRYQDTFYHNLLTGSPALDAGTSALCPTEDQRGFSRPLDGDGDGTATCDIGAVEYF